MSDTVITMRNTPFPATAWTEIETAKGQGEAARKAFAALCEAYYGPVYGVIVRRVPNSHKAQDLTQQFFQRLLENRAVIEKADRTRGKFRSFLSQRLHWFILEQFKKDKTERATEMLNEQSAKLIVEAETVEDPEFDLEWAKRTLIQALDRLEAKYRAEGNERRRQVFVKRRAQMGSGEIAAALKLTADTVKNELRAIKLDSEASLKAVVRATVSDDSFVNEEFEVIRRLLSSKQS